MRVLMLDGGDRTPYLSRLVARLSEAGAEMHYAGDPDWKDFGALEAAGVRCHVFGAKSKLDLRARWGVRRLLDRHGIEILHTMMSRDAYVGIKARRRRPVRVLVRRGAYVKVSRLDPSDRAIYGVRGADRFLTVSEHLKAHLVSRGLAAERITTVQTGIWSDELMPVERDLRAEYGVARDALLLGFVGQLRPVKGFDYLLAALAELRSRGVPFAVLVAGGGYEEAGEAIAAHGLGDHVHLVGYLGDIMTFTPNLDCLVLTSRIDASPRAAIEATVVGTPVIGTRVGGIPEILDDGRGGVLVDPASPRSLADALERVAGDRSELHSLAAHALARNRELYSVARCADLHREIYERLLLSPRTA